MTNSSLETQPLRRRPRTRPGHAGSRRPGLLFSTLVILGLVVAVAGIAPVAVGVIKGTATARGLQDAPAGLYAVVARTEGSEDVILAAPANNAGALREVARVRHLDGIAASGAVSPDGRQLALVNADGGTASRPMASLVVVDLSSGESRRLAGGLDTLQAPLWSADSASVVVARSSGEGPLISVALNAVPLGAGDERTVDRLDRVLGAYPVAFTPGGALVTVAIDSRGSTLRVGGADVQVLSPYITRDWRLSPDGTQLAFIEAATEGGVHYRQRVVALEQGAGAVTAQEAPADGPQALGVAWKPGAAAPAVGQEPPQDAGSGAVRAQAAGGFDVPLGYSPDGGALMVDAYPGASFREPGEPALTLVGAGGQRTRIEQAQRFFGWTAR